MAMMAPFVGYADVSVSLSMDRAEAILGDTIQMEIHVSGARQCDAPPIIEGLDSFQVTPGGSSSRVEIINGRIRSGIDFTFYITPSQSGTFQIGPARVRVDGQAFQSDTASLTVAKAALQTPSAKRPLLLTATLSAKKAYVEEQILYTLKLYLRTRASNISLQLPEQDHITFQQLGRPREYQGVLDGQTWQVVEVTYALLALEEREYRIDPARMEMTVFDSRGPSGRGLFDDPFFADPFFRTGRPVSVSSEPLQLNVVALPAKGKPNGFSGLVGDFTIASELTPAKVRAGESATLTVQVSGRGNIHRIPDLKMPPLDSLKIYADQPVVAPANDSKGLAGTKIMKWAIVAELPGDYTIPPLTLDFFDPKAGEYRTLKSREHPLAVLPGKGKMLVVKAEANQENGGDKSEKQAIQEVGRDILPLHTSLKHLGSRSWSPDGSAFLWTILLLPVFGYAATYTGVRLKRRSIRTLPAQRARLALRRLIRQCRHCRDGDVTGLMTALREYINDRLGLRLATLTAQEAAAILTSRGVSDETAGRLRDLLHQAEGAIYAGKSRVPALNAEEVPKIARAIERELK